MAIMTYEQWYDLTKETLNWRGSELTAVDKALKAYWQGPPSSDKLKALDTALTAYTTHLTKTKGDWKKHSRNKNGGMERLVDEVKDRLSGKELDGSYMLRGLLAEHRQQGLVRLFGGRKVVLKRRSRVAGMMNDAGKLQEAGGLVKDLITKVFAKEGVQEIPAVVEMLGSHFLNDMATAAMPFMGGVVSGGKALLKTWEAIDAVMDRKTVTSKIVYVPSGNAEKACQSLVALLNQRKSEALKRAGLYATSSLMQIAGEFFPGGRIVGAATQCATSFAAMYLDAKVAAKEAKQVLGANALLKRPAVELMHASEIFEVYPLVGAYFIRFGSANDLLSVIEDVIGTLHWREVVKDVKERHLAPLKTIALDFIKESPFELQGMHVSAGTYDKWYQAPGAMISGMSEKIQIGADKAIQTHASTNSIAGLLDKYEHGQVDHDDFVRAAQPWIVSPAAKKAVQERMKVELKGRTSYEAEDAHLRYGDLNGPRKVANPLAKEPLKPFTMQTPTKFRDVKPGMSKDW